MFPWAFANSRCGEDVAELGKELLLRGRKTHRVSASLVGFERRNLKPWEVRILLRGEGWRTEPNTLPVFPQDIC